MDVILHLGAHRTGTTTFQDYMCRHKETLEADGVGFWGPRRTRKGLFSGLMPGALVRKSRDPAARAQGRIQVMLALTEARGVQTLAISDENMIGSVRGNLRAQSLYPSIGERMARFARAFDGKISRVVLCTRSLELYWSSSCAFGVARGCDVPSDFDLQRIARSRRGWREVITDLACAIPGVEIRVIPFETAMGRPDALARLAIGIDAPTDTQRQWLNRGPDLPGLRRVLADRGHGHAQLPYGMGRWNPFAPDQTAALREVYEDDIMWLAAGADGLARLAEDRSRTRAGTTLPPTAKMEGQSYEQEQRPVA
jgi:hypothetical protein